MMLDEVGKQDRRRARERMSAHRIVLGEKHPYCARHLPLGGFQLGDAQDMGHMRPND